jgi:hypothetical protein
MMATRSGLPDVPIDAMSQSPGSASSAA